MEDKPIQMIFGSPNQPRYWRTNTIRDGLSQIIEENCAIHISYKVYSKIMGAIEFTNSGPIESKIYMNDRNRIYDQ